MPERRSCAASGVMLLLLLLFLLIFGLLWSGCEAQSYGVDAGAPPDGAAGSDRQSFFALQSCQQLLGGDGGEFFSPDYLCSNPPLWCNWSIQVEPGRRISLQLADWTAADACHLKQDQVHVEEPGRRRGGHLLLEKCWREAKFTSISNLLHVVLLIGGWPQHHYRGLHGRYRAFGPPVVYNPLQGFADGGWDPTDAGEFGPEREEPHADSDPMYDEYDWAVTMATEQPMKAAAAEAAENEHQATEPATPTEPATHTEPATPTEPATHTEPPTSQGTSRSERGASQTPSDQQPALREEPPTQTPREAEVLSEEVGGAPGQENMTAVTEVTEQVHPQPNVVELLSDHRGRQTVRNRSEVLHLPGDNLLEVAVEVNFNQDLHSWDDLAKSLLRSVKSLISKQLLDLHPQLAMSSKRIKRLSGGVLYIIWLQVRQARLGPRLHAAVHAAEHDLVGASIGLEGRGESAVVMSVSTADVNECGSQLVLCDANADCLNQFGSYQCRCRPGFQDESRLGSGGTVCVDLKSSGCGAAVWAETKGVYVLFFLLSAAVLMLLAAAGVLLRRHRRGAFLVRCRSRGSLAPTDHNNNSGRCYSDDTYPESELPPPPPPARGPREHRPASDLQLLRFGSLLPQDGYTPPPDGGKS